MNACKTFLRNTRLICLLSILLFSGISVVAQNPVGKSILADGFSSWIVYGVDNPTSIVEEVSVTGQPFAKALRINTFNKPAGSGNCSLNINLISPLQKGDVLWISFRTRSLESKRETGESNIELRVDQLVNGKYVWPPYLERGISFGKEWTETSIPFVIPKDVKVEDVKLVLQFDSYPQRFEIGPVTFLNCGQNVKLEDLPRSVVRYEGGEPDAPWRKAAAERIEKFRKGDLTIKVLDANGKPVRNAEVSVRMKRNAFNWGTATSSQRLLDEENADSKIYRDTLLKYFNQVVFENEMKWKVWSGQEPEKRGVQTKKAVEWLNTYKIPARGHVMIWPSWEHSPKFLADLKNDSAALRATILNHFKEQTAVMRGQFTEWDVINEPYAHHDVMDILGKDEMVKWFKLAHAGDPNVKLFLNDYTMFHGEGADSPSEKFFDNVKFLKENSAPIDAIGEQAHIGGTPPSIPKVLERLDRFAQLGLPIQISEFDINSNDDEFKARYLRDFLTALYSNPATIGFVQWGFWEGQHWFPVAAMWNKDWSVRKHGKVYADLVTKTWWTNADGKTSKDGTYKVGGFCGDYEVVVKINGETIKEQFSLTNQGKSLEIKLALTGFAQSKQSGTSKPELLFQSGFEGETKVVPYFNGNHQLIGGDKKLKYSNWSTNVEKRARAKNVSINYTGGDSTKRFAKIIPEPGNPKNNVFWFWLNEPFLASENQEKARVQVDFYGIDGGYKEFYQSVRVFLTEDFEVLKNYPRSINWLTISEFWNNEWWVKGEKYGFRITLGIGKPSGESNELNFILNAEDPGQKEIWEGHNTSVKVPIGKWFTMDYYVKEGNDKTGRFYMAITPEGGQKQVVFDVQNYTHMTKDPAPNGYTGYNPMKLYTSKELVSYVKSQGKTLQIYWDDFKLWTNKRP